LNLKITTPDLSSDQLELLLKTNFMEALKDSSLRSFSFSSEVRTLLATVSGEPAAVLLYRTVQKEILAEIDFVATGLKFRRKGLSALLVAYLAGRFAEIWLELSAKNTVARAFYQKNGFVLQGRRPDYYVKTLKGSPSGSPFFCTKSLF